MPRAPSEMLQGTVDVLILRTLSWQPMHGYGISAWVRERSRDVLSIEGAALYQAFTDSSENASSSRRGDSRRTIARRSSTS
jgi:DNA-binding PadR family transcriptional regulator